MPEQYFIFAAWAFDIDAAQTRLASHPREQFQAEFTGWARAFGLHEQPDGHFPLIAGPDLDREYAMTTDLDQPLIFATLQAPGTVPELLLIDGWHRTWTRRVPEPAAPLKKVAVSTTFNAAHLPPAAPADAGELAGLLLAGLIAPGEDLFRTSPLPSPEPVAVVTVDGRLRTPTGTEFSGPREAISCLEDPRYEPIAWQCFTTADQLCLGALRQRTEPEQPGTTRASGSLLPLIGAGLLHPGATLRFEMTTGRGQTGQRVRLLAVATAEVTGDGWLAMTDGAVYAAPSPAAAARCGMLTNGWKAWHRADDGRSLLTLRRAAGITPTPRTRH